MIGGISAVHMGALNTSTSHGMIGISPAQPRQNQAIDFRRLGLELT